MNMKSLERTINILELLKWAFAGMTFATAVIGAFQISDGWLWYLALSGVLFPSIIFFVEGKNHGERSL